jgi:predicted AlkP superfamily phosphohydrolase/phosphomutase
MSTKSLLIELDSVHSRLIQHAAVSGFMPRLARLMYGGVCRPVEFEIPLQVAAWQSSQTGLSAVDHQFVSFDNLRSGSYRNTRGFRHAAHLTRYWDYLSEAGKRVLVFNSVMGKSVSGELNGIHICAFSTHTTGDYDPIDTYPAHYASELSHRFPDDLYHIEDWGSQTFLNPSRFLKSVRMNLARKAQVCCEIMERERWDHVHIGLDDLHGLGHMLIRNLDETLKGASSAGSVDEKSMMFTACSALDEAIADVIDAAGPNVNVACLMMGGIDCENTWSHQLDSLLALFRTDGHRGQTRIYNRLGGIWNRLPHTAKRSILPLKSRLRDLYLVNRRRSEPAFSMPLNEESGCIRINLRGREPRGTIEPGAHYERLCAEITTQLESVRDVESGARLVQEVVHLPTRLKYDPALPTSLPDLVVVWTRDKTIEEVILANGARYKRAFRPARAGDHVIDGMLILNGPQWQNVEPEGTCSVLDVTPTILRVHGQPVHRTMPGRPLDECMTGAVAAS